MTRPCRNQVRGACVGLPALLALSIAIGAPPAIAADAATNTQDEPSSAWVDLGAVGATLLYAPAKLAYAVTGTVISGLAWAASGANNDVARSIFEPAVGGSYVVTAAHLRGTRELHFVGRPAPASLAESGPAGQTADTVGPEALPTRAAVPQPSEPAYSPRSPETPMTITGPGTGLRTGPRVQQVTRSETAQSEPVEPAAAEPGLVPAVSAGPSRQEAVRGPADASPASSEAARSANSAADVERESTVWVYRPPKTGSR